MLLLLCMVKSTSEGIPKMAFPESHARDKGKREPGRSARDLPQTLAFRKNIDFLLGCNCHCRCLPPFHPAQELLALCPSFSGVSPVF